LENSFLYGESNQRNRRGEPMGRHDDRTTFGATCVFLLVCAVLWGCDKKPGARPEAAALDARETTDAARPATPHAQLVKEARSKLNAFGVLPEEFESEENPITPGKVTLGKQLYYDTRLSRGRDISCNSCHALAAYGVDKTPVSEGFQGQHGSRNAPTVYNAAGKIAQFWEGRAADVEDQASGPMTNPVEMAMPSGEYVVEVVKSIPGYRKEFERVFPDQKEPVTLENITRAIGAFERKLTTPSPWDEFIAGDDDAADDAQLRGFLTFVDVGCVACHNTALVGGRSFQKLGVVKEWHDETDLGRYEVSGKESDKMVFVVPTLRNIAETEPYYHDGSVKTLPEAVRKMGEYQLGKTLTDEQVDSIVTWLNMLTGEIPHEIIKKPELPPDGPDTPQAQLPDD
jgi:cytochrome c peroxidase